MEELEFLRLKAIIDEKSIRRTVYHKIVKDGEQKIKNKRKNNSKSL